ncbi:MAG: anti-sigma factor [Oscillospiraceae bacterium]
MNECNKYLEMMSTMIDGELSHAESAELKAHIRTCPACQAAYGAFSSISAEMNDLIPAPDGLFSSVIEKLETAKKSAHRPPRKRYVVAAACFALICVAGIGYGLLDPGSHGSPSAGVLMGEFTTANDTITSYEVQSGAAMDGASASDGTESSRSKTMTAAAPEPSEYGFDECAPSEAAAESDPLVYVNSVVTSDENSAVLSLMAYSDDTKSITLSDESTIEKLLTYFEYGESAEVPSGQPLAVIELADSSHITVWDDGETITCELGGVVFHPMGPDEDIRSFIDELC